MKLRGKMKATKARGAAPSMTRALQRACQTIRYRELLSDQAEGLGSAGEGADSDSPSSDT